MLLKFEKRHAVEFLFKIRIDTESCMLLGLCGCAFAEKVLSLMFLLEYSMSLIRNNIEHCKVFSLERSLKTFFKISNSIVYKIEHSDTT